MDEARVQETADGFAAIGSKPRLEVLRVLVRAGTEGLTIGEIQRRTGMPASTLAHHLKQMNEAGLLLQTRKGRSTVTAANYDRLETLAQFILSECCIDRSPKSGTVGLGEAK